MGCLCDQQRTEVTDPAEQLACPYCFGTWPLCADCAPEHEKRCSCRHVTNYATQPGFCLGEGCLKPGAVQKTVPVLCVSDNAVEGTLEEIERRRSGNVQAAS